MKTLQAILLIGLTTLYCSCQEEGETLIADPVTVLSFTLQKLNSEDQGIYKVKTSHVVARRSSWLGKPIFEDSIWISKEIEFESQLNNNEPLLIEVLKRNFENNSDLLYLDEEFTDNRYYRHWNYKSTEIEIDKLWKNNQQGGILLNFNYSHFLDPEIHVIKAQKVLVNGVEKTYVEIKFSGKAFGYYDPEGTMMVVYHITNGFFQGVIE